MLHKNFACVSLAQLEIVTAGSCGEVAADFLIAQIGKHHAVIPVNIHGRGSRRKLHKADIRPIRAEVTVAVLDGQRRKRICQTCHRNGINAAGLHLPSAERSEDL